MERFGRIVFFVSIFVFSFTGSYSQEKEMWDSANSLYSQANYNDALKEYLAIEKSGYASWQLYYNIGNCYFKNRNYGLSILYYERALRINPAGKDIKFNLGYAKQFTVDKIDEVPDFILKTWIRDVNYSLTSDIWTTISLVFFALTALLLLYFRYGPTSFARKSAFFVAMISLLVVCIATLFAWNQRNEYQKENEAIVMAPVSTVRNSPDNSGSTLFILHEGTKVELIEELGNWKRVELGDGRQGWIADSEIEII